MGSKDPKEKLQDKGSRCGKQKVPCSIEYPRTTASNRHLVIWSSVDPPLLVTGGYP